MDKETRVHPQVLGEKINSSRDSVDPLSQSVMKMKGERRFAEPRFALIDIGETSAARREHIPHMEHYSKADLIQSEARSNAEYCRSRHGERIRGWMAADRGCGCCYSSTSESDQSGDFSFSFIFPYDARVWPRCRQINGHAFGNRAVASRRQRRPRANCISSLIRKII
jgi:hypothetical protein